MLVLILHCFACVYQYPRQITTPTIKAGFGIDGELSGQLLYMNIPLNPGK